MIQLRFAAGEVSTLASGQISSPDDAVPPPDAQQGRLDWSARANPDYHSQVKGELELGDSSPSESEMNDGSAPEGDA